MAYYREISISNAYRMFNHGPLVLVSTQSSAGEPDIAPVAWNCPVKKSPTSILAAISTDHKTFSNIESSNEMIICVPCGTQKELVVKTGSVSGWRVDKFDEFKIESVEGAFIKARIPVGCLGYIECRVKKIVDFDGEALVIGEAVCAGADPESFMDRVMPENPGGRTLHHLGGSDFAVPRVLASCED